MTWSFLPSDWGLSLVRIRMNTLSQWQWTRRDMAGEKALAQKFERSFDKRVFDLTLGGLPYKLRSSHDEKTVKELVDFVDQKIQHAMLATKSGSYQSAAVLAALNIAEELILLKRQALKELNRLEERANRISLDLESSKVLKPEGQT